MEPIDGCDGRADGLLRETAKMSKMATAITHARAAVTIFGCTVSGGLVAIPKSYQSASLIPSLFMSLIAGPTTGLSLLALAMVSRRAGDVSTYGEVAGKLTGGPFLGAFVDLLISIFLIGVLTGSFIVLRDWFESLVSKQEYSTFATIGVAALGMLPLALPRRIGALAYSSFLSLAGFSLLVIVLLAYGLQEEAAPAHNNHNNNNASSVWWPETFDPLELGLSFNVQIYSFACQFQLMSIFQDLRSRLESSSSSSSSSTVATAVTASSPPRVRFGAVVGGAVGGMICLFGLTGIFGVLAFPGVQVSGDILKTLDTKPLGPAVRGCLAVAIGLSGPLMIHPTREGFVRFGALIAGRTGLITPRRAELIAEKPPLAIHVLLTALIVATSTTIALTFDQLMVLVSYLGAFLLCPLGLAFPAVALVLLPPPATAAAGQTAAAAAATGVAPLMASAIDGTVNEPATQSDAGGKKNGAAARRGDGRGWAIWLLAAWLVLVALITVGVSVANLIVKAAKE